MLWLGASRVSSGEIEVGTLVAYLTYLVQILMSVVMATFMVSMIPRAVGVGRPHPGGARHAAERRPSGPPGTRRHPARRARVPRRRLPLSRRRAPGARPDVSFATAPGQTTAIVGSTGAGKSTLVNLILRLFDSTEGTCKVGGVDVHDLDPDVLWQHDRPRPPAAVPVLGHGREQPRSTASPTPPRKRCGWRSRSRRRPTSCGRCPAGSNARIEQGGTNVSGGQRQRLSIARALIRRPDIYVFDDSFSALDLATDARLRAALGPYTKDSAVVIVAQRVSTIATADNILVLEDGVVIGHGTHDELIRDNPTYAEIVQSPDRREERGMTLIDDQEERRGARSRGAGDPRRRPLELGRCSRRAFEGLQERAAPPGPACSGRCGSSSSSSR